MRWWALMLLAVPGSAYAHAGHEHAEAPGWTFDPLLVLPLLFALGLYLLGARRLWQRSDLSHPAQRRTTRLFVSGLAVLALALLSPLHEGGERSFTLHMIEHELIMLVATALLAGSGAGGALAWGLRKSWRSLPAGAPARLWRAVTEPVTATVLQAAALVAWHLPVLFDLALRQPAVHILQHASFFTTSLVFWWAMLHARGDRSRYGVSALCLFVTSLVGGALGALMAVSNSPWYAPYAAMPLTGIGLQPAADQQLAGLIMWIPGGLVHAGAALVFLHRWLKAAETSHAPVPQQ
ncbi:cytochrome c oxidase assembly protein [Sphingomonas sp. BN140010]|uniref:Cytochrome c oxidase assembly protein n=1 Tax=Sphingomonas arvum TaxID=2992113 RepID=A0ABT3JH86_9SPHN|nr:cytochrome c oxidase assembly protein [Sphingomonas sp. BN140010]MCW3798442.1 cytochrome c oxidase assembly protein [Sphingomonas sp. BN140010]